MTVRFITSWNGYKPGDIATLEDALESALTAGHLAESYTAPSTDVLARLRIAADGSVEGIVAPDGDVQSLGGGAFTALTDAPATIEMGSFLIGNFEADGLQWLSRMRYDDANSRVTFSPANPDTDWLGGSIGMVGPNGLATANLYVEEGPTGDQPYANQLTEAKNSNASVRNQVRHEADLSHAGTKWQFLATGKQLEIGTTTDGSYLTLGGGNLVVTGLPTSDPAVAGALWNNGGVLSISAG